MPTEKPRIVCQFSCGAASAVATKLALAEYSATHDVQIVNAFLANEHEDNRRFALDCEAWFGRPITVLRDEKYGADALEVFRRERYIKNQYGAPCSKLLKRRLLDTWKQTGDLMVFGFTAEEADQLDEFRERNPDRPVIAPLINRGLGKEDCKAMILRAGIELPLMYIAWLRERQLHRLREGRRRLLPRDPRRFPGSVRGPVFEPGRLGRGFLPISKPHHQRPILSARTRRWPGSAQREEPVLLFFGELAETDYLRNAMGTRPS